MPDISPTHFSIRICQRRVNMLAQATIDAIKKLFDKKSRIFRKENMNTRKFARSFIALFLIASSSGAWAQIYVNDLKNQASINQDFTVFNALNNNSTFSANPSYGLELLSTPPQSGVVAIYKNTYLPTSQNWTVTIKSHISAFSNSQLDPWYNAGLSLLKFTNTPAESFPNRVNLLFTRRDLSDENQTGGNMTNSIEDGLYTGGTENPNTYIPLELTEDLYLKYEYAAQNKTVSLFYGTASNNYTHLSSHNLNAAWGLSDSDSLVLALTAANQPYLQVSTEPVLSGQIYLSDLNVNVVPEPSVLCLVGLSTGLLLIRSLRKSRNEAAPDNHDLHS